MKNKNKLKSMSGLVLINQETKELLFQKRPKETKWNPNVWGFFLEEKMKEMKVKKNV